MTAPLTPGFRSRTADRPEDDLGDRRRTAPGRDHGSATLRMDRGHSVLVLVDYQGRLLTAIHDAERVVERAVFLADVARELGVPVIGTAQNPTKLGPNVEAVQSRCADIVEKMHFGACEGGLLERLDALAAEAPSANGARVPENLDVVVAGCEAHVCLLQTALGLLEAGRRVWVVSDACGSRDPVDHELAMRRLEAAGAGVVSSEMVAFEWTLTCEHDRFRAVSALVKGKVLGV